MDWQKFFQIPPDITIWSILDSNVFAVVIGVYLTWRLSMLKREVSKAEENAKEAVAAAEASELIAAAVEAENEEEAAQSNTAFNDGRLSDIENFRDQAADMVKKGRAFLRRRAQQDPDRRHQKTYDRVDQRSTIALALALKERQQLSLSEFGGAVTLFTTWNKYEKGRAASKVVPSRDYESMRSAFHNLTGTDPV